MLGTEDRRFFFFASVVVGISTCTRMIQQQCVSCFRVRALLVRVRVLLFLLASFWVVYPCFVADDVGEREACWDSRSTQRTQPNPTTHSVFGASCV